MKRRFLGSVVMIAIVMIGCSAVREVVTWHQARYEEVSSFVSRVRPWKGDPLPHYRIGCYYQELGEHAKAIEAFEKVISIDPNYYRAYNGLGISYDLTGNHEKAVESYKTALRINPEQDYIFNNLGYSYLLQNRTDEAIDCFRMAIKLNGQDKRYRNNLGLAYATKGDFEQALREFTLAENENVAYRRLADFCRKNGLPYLAADYEKKALEVSQAKRSETQQRPVPAEERTVMAKSDRAEPGESKEIIEKPLGTVEVRLGEGSIESDGAKKAKHEATVAAAELREMRGSSVQPAQLKEKIEPKSPEQVKSENRKVPSSIGGAGVEVSNGNGVNNMARKVGDYLKRMGLNVVRLTNADNFFYPRTRIFYMEGHEDEARYIGEQLPVGKDKITSVKKFDRPNVTVKVLIGRDMIPHRKAFFEEQTVPQKRQEVARARKELKQR